jgi:hypothetical protein
MQAPPGPDRAGAPTAGYFFSFGPLVANALA